MTGLALPNFTVDQFRSSLAFQSRLLRLQPGDQIQHLHRSVYLVNTPFASTQLSCNVFPIWRTGSSGQSHLPRCPNMWPSGRSVRLCDSSKRPCPLGKEDITWRLSGMLKCGPYGVQIPGTHCSKVQTPLLYTSVTINFLTKNNLQHLTLCHI